MPYSSTGFNAEELYKEAAEILPLSKPGESPEESWSQSPACPAGYPRLNGSLDPHLMWYLGKPGHWWISFLKDKMFPEANTYAHDFSLSSLAASLLSFLRFVLPVCSNSIWAMSWIYLLNVLNPGSQGRKLPWLMVWWVPEIVSLRLLCACDIVSLLAVHYIFKDLPHGCLQGIPNTSKNTDPQLFSHSLGIRGNSGNLLFGVNYLNWFETT